MKHWMSIALTLAFLPSVWATPNQQNIFEEVLYNDFQQNILEGSTSSRFSGFTAQEQSLYVDALWDLSEDGNEMALKTLNELEPLHYELTEQLRVAILKLKNQRADKLPPELEAELLNALLNPLVDVRLIYTIAAYEAELLAAGHDKLISYAKNHPPYFDISEDEIRSKETTDSVITDLFYNAPDTTIYMNGEYVKSVKIFMFCRDNRLYPCLMTMRDIHGEIVRNADGSIWTHRALASSARGLPSYTRNGNTPAGIFTIDSVMPSADQQLSFGKFRRMILNFVPKSQDEKLLKSLLPESSHREDWWKPTIVARDAGRNLFRIHGTGKLNKDPMTPYYPFMRTSGCIAQRENSYPEMKYQDQRELLDDIMTAMDLVPNYQNEVKVKGILYLMEIDDKNGPVLAEDLALRGIE
ncbi:MAG: hypothetical protein NDI69_02080 [Bacteriovoracaceae bacterium]|nr:hypothetical protein [Bacteriovoracaceae bacterium]